MRTIVLGIAAAGLLAACSGDTAKEAKKAAKADALQPGEYEVTDKVEELRSTDNTTPATTMKAAAAGEASPTSRICVGKDGAIDPKVFAEAGDKCTSTGSYMRGGRLSYQFNCTRAGKGGQALAASLDLARHVERWGYRLVQEDESLREFIQIMQTLPKI